MKLTKELFVIPGLNSSYFYLYAPLKKSILKVNPATVRLLKEINAGIQTHDSGDVIKKLIDKGILVEDKEKPVVFEREIGYSPTSVTLFPTFNCNLKCIYCFSEGGDHSSNIMDFNIAKRAIDFIIQNSKEKNSKKVSLGLLGGGEPFFDKCMGVVKKSVAYFQDRASENSFDFEVNAVTNGVIRSNEDLLWISNNINNLSDYIVTIQFN